MKTFEQSQAERKERATIALADFDREDMIAAHFPQSIRDQIKFVHLFGRGPTVAFEVDTLADALPILAELEPVTYFHITGGTFGHVSPREWIKVRDWEAAKEETEFCAPYMEAASGSGWSECKLKVYIHLDGVKLCKVTIAIASPPSDWTPRMVQDYHASNGRKVAGPLRRVVNGLGQCKLVTWSTGSPDCARATYLFHDAIAWAQFVERNTVAKVAA